MSIINSLIVAWVNGYIEIGDAGSIGTYDRREGILDGGDLYDVDALVRLAEQNLAITKAPTTSIVATVDDVDGDSGHSPYVAFALGDTVTVPGIAGGTQSVRCVGITCTQDGDGYIDVATEFSTVRDLSEERVQRWLARTANGTLDGRSPTPTISVSSPSIVSSGVASPITVGLATDGAYAPIVGDLSAGKTPGSRGFLYRLAINARSAGTGTTTIRVDVNGTQINTVGLGPNAISGVTELDINAVRIVELTDIFTFEVTASGGAEGISVDAYISPIGE